MSKNNRIEEIELFSSSESGHTDISFNSSYCSDQEDDEKDYTDIVTSLKEQVDMMTINNPKIKDNIPFIRKKGKQ